ncbi:MAG: hypothetical protein HKP40_10640 [Litoreibacter sp.]|nr:hypothetical protein [Litoreibacter sp.]
MQNQIFGLSFGFAALLLAADMASAQPVARCAQRDVIIEKLASSYGESRRSMGLAGDNSIIEMFASTDSGTWTITMTRPNGITCLVAAGSGYETVEEELPAKLGLPT